MPNNNPGGANGTSMFEGFSDETAYGAVKRLKQNTQAAPLAKPRPKSRQQPQRPVQPSAVQQLAEAPPPPQAIWAEVALIPGISPLAAEYAADA